MRFECKRSDAATKWYEINLIPIGSDFFSVTVSYGVKGASGEDSILQRITSVYAGNYLDAIQQLSDKVRDREILGYVKIEQKQE
jgi:hypothetical protein